MPKPTPGAEEQSVLVADDDPVSRRLLQRVLEAAGLEVVVASDGATTLAALDERVTVALLDLAMPEPDGRECLRVIKQTRPGVEVVIVTGSSEIADAVDAMKNGAFDYVTKPIHPEALVAIVKNALATARLRQENRELREALHLPLAQSVLAGASAATQRVLETARRVAGLDVGVLISGETGVGKGVVARLIHSLSPRAARPFVVVSCTALPRELVEAQLFGHEKGAFTGAHEARPGRVEMADGGTLMLDEIGDMPIDLQPKLLSFLQDRSFERIGGNRTRRVDVRVIAATHQDLGRMVEEKRFRQDLYYRLNVLPLRVEPLRARREDVRPLAEQLLGSIAKRRRAPPCRLTDEAQAALVAYDWPGNVRELENVLERATVFAEGGLVRAEDLPPEVRDGALRPAAEPPKAPGSPYLGKSLEQIEREAILDTLEACGGNKSEAARRLGVAEKTIYNKLARIKAARQAGH
jgi:DNA-binding NtrC family response regulator